MQCDILIRGGEVIDPGQQLRGVRDLAVCGDRIAALAENLARRDRQAHHRRPRPVCRAGAHRFAFARLSAFAVRPGPDPLCPAGGVTTMLDAGTAGSYNFAAFRKETIDRAETQIFALVNLSCIGLIAANLGELLDRRYADVAGVVRTIREHPDVAVGVKIRAGKHIIGDREQGWANLRDAIRAARESGTWLMVHIGDCPMSIPELVNELAPGDCITHCFKGGSTRIVDDAGRLFDDVRLAKERGVIFDVGHGAGSFQWEVVEAALEQGFEPTTISTDLHTYNLHGPVYDMPTTMSKFLMLGMPLDRVIELSTIAPAAILKRAGELGTLRVGTVADIALLERRTGRFIFTDSYKQDRVGNELLIAAATIRRGEIVPGGGGLRMRNLAE